MILRFAVRELGRHPARTLLAVAGVAIAGAMLLDMLMLSRGMQVSFRDLLEGAGYELRVAPAGTLPLETDATLAGASELAARLGREAGVAAVAPVLAGNLAASVGTSAVDGAEMDPTRVFALGIDPERQGVFRMVEGVPPSGPRDVVVSEEVRRTFGDTDGLQLAPYESFGRAGAGAPRRFRVTGVARFLYASSSELPVALPIDALRELTDRPDEASFFMLRAAEATNADTLAARLAASNPSVEVASVGDLVERAEIRLSYFRQLALILGTVSLVVTALLVGTIAAVSINDRYGTIAAARAIGISRRSILLALVAETVATALVAAVLGMGIGVVVAGRLDTILSDFPGLPAAVRFFVLEPDMIAVAVLGIVGVAVVAAAVPAWHVTRLPIATTLHREEP